MNQNKKTIGIIGGGYVGQAFAEMVKNHYQVLIFDPNLATFTTKEEVSKADLGVICVPTPMSNDGSCDTSIVEQTLEWLNTPVILIKSTVAIGTTERLKKQFNKRIVMSPEYVGEGKYRVSPRMDFQTDMGATPFLILGGDNIDCNYILDLLIPVLGPEKKIHKMTAIEAEIVKYMENTYFGVKITFAQEMYDICKQFGADWYSVWQGWAADPRVDVMHTAVFPEARGFSGKCLPKDLNGLVYASKQAGYTPTMLEAMLKSNKIIREKNGQKLDY